MATIRAAAEIVRHDILVLETLKNIAREESKETHIEELNRQITPV